MIDIPENYFLNDFVDELMDLECGGKVGLGVQKLGDAPFGGPRQLVTGPVEAQNTAGPWEGVVESIKTNNIPSLEHLDFPCERERWRRRESVKNKREMALRWQESKDSGRTYLGEVVLEVEVISLLAEIIFPLGGILGGLRKEIRILGIVGRLGAISEVEMDMVIMGMGERDFSRGIMVATLELTGGDLRDLEISMDRGKEWFSTTDK